jgi:hypothetical protein
MAASIFSPARLEALQRVLSQVEFFLLNRAINAAASASTNAIDRAVSDVRRAALEYMSMLGKLLHSEANAIADKDRGPNARSLTAAERRLVVSAYGRAVSPSLVRIVPGPGYSVVALAAFIKGNPAITIGNTIYLRWGSKLIDYKNLDRSDEGIRLILHEYSHVVQYARLGFSVFGARYAAELARVGGDANKLYDYKAGDNPYAKQTIEAQAQMVGDYSVARRHSDPANSAAARRLRSRLAGSGVYGL